MFPSSKKETLQKPWDLWSPLNWWLSSNMSRQTRIIWYSTDKIHRQNIPLLCEPFRTKLVQMTDFLRLIHSSAHLKSSKSEQYFNSWDYRAAQRVFLPTKYNSDEGNDSWKQLKCFKEASSVFPEMKTSFLCLLRSIAHFVMWTSLSKRLKVGRHYLSVEIYIIFQKLCQTCFLRTFKLPYCALWFKKCYMQAQTSSKMSLAETVNVRLLHSLFACGVQTGSEDQANTANKSQHFSRYQKSPAGFISFSSW